ncbi:MAG: toll/interleukin-1 receptor domain-containing protein [Acidimicrobiales bacterium]
MGELVRLFVSYSRRDVKFVDALRGHLSALSEWQGRVTVWWDGAIETGAEWRAELLNELDSADIVVFLVSRDLLASEFVRTIEVARALVRMEGGLCDIIPVRIRAVDPRGTPFEHLQWIPQEVPIGSPGNDQAWVQVAKSIRRAVARQEQKRAEPTEEQGPSELRTLATVPDVRSPIVSSNEAHAPSDTAGKILQFRRTVAPVSFASMPLGEPTEHEIHRVRHSDLIAILFDAKFRCSSEWSVDSLRLSRLRRELERSLNSQQLHSQWVEYTKDLLRSIEIMSTNGPLDQRTLASGRAAALRDVLLAIATSSPL